MKNRLEQLKDEIKDMTPSRAEGLDFVSGYITATMEALELLDQAYQQEMTDDINSRILEYKKTGWSTKGVSDEWHTFGELYYHRMMLFLSLQLAHKDKAWKSRLHDDGTMFDDSFIVGLETPQGSYTYHYNLRFWDMFDEIQELDRAPVFDGHQPEDITRLLGLYETVDDEQLYEVRLPLPEDDNHSYSLLDSRGVVWRKEEPFGKYQMTREEIANLDERYMAFAVPVGSN